MNRIKSQKENLIGITNFLGGKKIAVQFYGSHSLTEDGIVMPFEDQMAIVSHYLHNRGFRFAQPYEGKAEGLLEDIYQIYQNNSEAHCVSEAWTLFLIRRFVLGSFFTCGQSQIYVYRFIRRYWWI